MSNTHRNWITSQAPLPPRYFSATRSYFNISPSPESSENNSTASGNYSTTADQNLNTTIAQAMDRNHTDDIIQPLSIMQQQREEQSHQSQEGGNQQNQQEEDHQNDQSEEDEQEDLFGNMFGQNPRSDYITAMQNLNQTMQQMRIQTGMRETHLIPLPTFGGGEQDPLAWLHSFHDACIANNMVEERRFDLLPVYLKGIAHTWWREVGHRITLWDNMTQQNRSFTHCFRRKWCTPHQKSRWMNQLRNRIQKPGETVDEYWDAITALYYRVDPNDNYPVEDKLQQFVGGLRNEIRGPVEISIPADIEEALNRARAVESTLSRHAPLSAYSMLSSSTTTNHELQDIRLALTQLTQGFQQLATQQTPRRNINNARETRTCNKCGKRGHIAINCRSNQSNNQRNNYNNNGRSNYNNNNNNNRGNRNCFTCNKPGHIAKNCPQRNQQQSSNQAGSSNNNRNQWMNAPMGEFLETAKQVKESLN